MRRVAVLLAGLALQLQPVSMEALGMEHMSDWLPIAEWRRCKALAGPGLVFEIRNADGQTLYAPCSDAPPEPAWDWTSPMTEFRAVPEAPPRHSTPIPAPAQ